MGLTYLLRVLLALTQLALQITVTAAFYTINAALLLSFALVRLANVIGMAALTALMIPMDILSWPAGSFGVLGAGLSMALLGASAPIAVAALVGFVGGLIVSNYTALLHEKESDWEQKPATFWTRLTTTRGNHWGDNFSLLALLTGVTLIGLTLSGVTPFALAITSLSKSVLFAYATFAAGMGVLAVGVVLPMAVNLPSALLMCCGPKGPLFPPAAASSSSSEQGQDFFPDLQQQQQVQTGAPNNNGAVASSVSIGNDDETGLGQQQQQQQQQ
jgi:predicted small lipoprotein YifL